MGRRERGATGGVRTQCYNASAVGQGGCGIHRAQWRVGALMPSLPFLLLPPWPPTLPSSSWPPSWRAACSSGLLPPPPRGSACEPHSEGRKFLHSMHPSYRPCHTVKAYRPCHTVKAYILFLVMVTCTTTSVLLVSWVPTNNHTLSIYHSLPLSDSCEVVNQAVPVMNQALPVMNQAVPVMNQAVPVLQTT